MTPEQTVERIADKHALGVYAKARSDAGSRVDDQLKADLAQLLALDLFGSERSKRWEAIDGTCGKFYNLADVSWFYHAEVAVAVPLFGRAADKHRQLKQQHGITDGIDVFKKVMAGERPSREGWWSGTPPSALATLPKGSKITGLARPTAKPCVAASIMLPDFGSVVSAVPACACVRGEV